MANLIQATVYQIDGSPLPSSAIVDFQTSNLVIREAAINIAEVNSAILYYNVPNNQLSVQTFYVGELLADLVDAANVGTTTQVQATVLEINEDPQVPGGVQYSFPANEILVGESVNAVTGVNSYIQFKNVKYFVSEFQADLLVSGNGASAYEVYTALLTQSGGSVPSTTVGDETLNKGVTYTIVNLEAGDNLIPYGAPNNQVGTSFVCNQEVSIWGNPLSTVSYDSGAPVVTVLENTIGNIWFTYVGVGEYAINSNGLFSINKTIGFVTFNNCCNSGLGDKPFLAINPSSVNSVSISSATDGILTDAVIQNTPIEIRVYN